MYGQSSLREYHLYHIFELFKPFLSKEYKVKSINIIMITLPRYNETYSSIFFASLTLPCLTFYREFCYILEGKNNYTK